MENFFERLEALIRELPDKWYSLLCAIIAVFLCLVLFFTSCSYKTSLTGTKITVDTLHYKHLHYSKNYNYEK